MLHAPVLLALLAILCVTILVYGLAAWSSDEGTSSAGSCGADPECVERSQAGDAQRLFAPDSVWNRELPRQVALDPGSAARAGALAREVFSKVAAGLHPAIAADSYSTPIYEVPRGQPLVRVQLDTGPWGNPLRKAFAPGVPIPRNAKPAVGTDGHMTVYQPSTDRMWEFWRAVRQGDGWHASWGGAMRDVSKSPGYYSPESWSRLSPKQGWNWGATATSLPVAAGVMTITELRVGVVEHVLAMAVPNPCKELVARPAQRGDGHNRSLNCMPEGAHLQLDPSLNVDRLALTRLGEIAARAAQRYGLIVRDGTGLENSVALYAEAPQGGPSPYRGEHGLFGGLQPWKVLHNFPWRELRVLRFDACRNPPCAS